ncbi:MAG: hypothetical protein ABI658_27575 [Acidimicrobiales bacterium]
MPVLVDFDERIDDESDLPLSCSLPPRSDTSLPPAVDEALGLRAAYERTFAATRRTGVVRLGGADHVADLVAAFVRIANGVPIDDAGIPANMIGQAALDVRAYYEEAALALADHVPAARRAESWFYRSTHAGTALRGARDALREADVSRGVWFALVPTGQ